jgi:hypothetical protein
MERGFSGFNVEAGRGGGAICSKAESEGLVGDCVESLKDGFFGGAIDYTAIVEFTAN